MSDAGQGSVLSVADRVRYVSGPLLTTAVVLLVAAGRAGAMPGLPLILMLTVAYAVLAGGRVAGLLSSAISVIGLIAFVPMAGPPRNLERVLVFAVSAPLVILTLGMLRRRQAELLVREQRARAEAESERKKGVIILESISEAFFSVDRRWRYISVNNQAERLVGRPQHELLGKTIWDAAPDLVGSVWEREYRRSLEQQVPVHFEARNPALGGWFDAHAYPTPEGLSIYVRSIDQRRRAEEGLGERARQQAAVASLGQEALLGGDLRSLMDSAVRMLTSTLDIEFAKLLEVQPDGRELVMRAGVGWRRGIDYCVPADEGSQAGYTLSCGVPVIVTDLHSETRFHGPRLLLEHGVVSGMSVIISGRERPFGILGAHTSRRRTFSQDDVNFLQAIANLLADAIERKRAEEALAESERRFRQLAENVREVFYIRSVHPPQFLYVSPACERVWGRSCHDLYERSSDWLNAVHPEDRPRVEKSIAAAAVSFDAEYRVLRADGTVRWIHDRFAPVPDEHGQPYRVVGIAEDVSEVRDVAESAKRLAASQASVRARDEVLAVVAHDLRNPLSAISTAAGLATKPEVSDERRAQYAGTIKRAVISAERLVRDLLDVARLEAGQIGLQLEPLDLRALVHAAREQCLPLATERDLTLEALADPDLPPAWGDRDRLLQVLGNLIDNALKFTSAGGCITLRVRKTGEGVELSVADTGSGIVPEKLPHVFDRFWRGHPGDRKGLGLGLAIVQGIVSAHHGRVWVESEVGRGSVFHFTVPSAPSRVPPC